MYKLCVFFLFLFGYCDCKVIHIEPQTQSQSPNSISQDDMVPRLSWGALSSNATTPLIRPVEYVVIHHTYIPAVCWNLENCSIAMRSMQTYHNSLGWGDIGYNFCIGGDGKIYEGRGWTIRGIHAGPANGRSIGICLIGDWRTQLPPQVVLDHAKGLIKIGVELGVINKNYKLVGHQQVMSTECPGTSLMEEIATWKRFVPGNITFN